jgi:hypothetical protein
LTAPLLPEDFEPLRRYLDGLEGRISRLEEPQEPGPVYACTKAHLPAAGKFINAVARVTDTNILVASDGANWISQKTGLPV